MKHKIIFPILIGFFLVASCNETYSPPVKPRGGDGDKSAPECILGTKWRHIYGTPYLGFPTSHNELSFGTNIYGLNRLQTSDEQEFSNPNALIHINYYIKPDIEIYRGESTDRIYTGHIKNDTMFLFHRSLRFPWNDSNSCALFTRIRD